MSPLLSDALWIVLYPLALLWSAAAVLRRKLPRPAPFSPKRKTLIVGNIHSGGSGKTPLVAAIAERFTAFRPVIVSRGYRAKASADGARVDLSAEQGPAKYGDEPWMLARRLGVPVFVGRNRGGALERAEAATEGSFFLLDDAFQNLSFRHDTDLVAIQTDRGVDEAYCLPLGDLREPFAALRRASALVLVRGTQPEGPAAWRAFLEKWIPGVPVFEATPRVDGIFGSEGKVETASGTEWGAFCGIARPESFRATLAGLFSPRFLESFPDHHRYSPKDVAFLLRQTEKHHVHQIVTTEKDWHKVAPLFAGRKQPLYYLRLGYVFDEQFWYFLQSRLETA